MLVDVWDVEQDVCTGVDRNGNELSVKRYAYTFEF